MQENQMDHDSQHFATLPKTRLRLTMPLPPLFWNHTKFETANLYQPFNRTSRTIQSIIAPCPSFEAYFLPATEARSRPFPAMSSTSAAEGLNALPHPQDSTRFHKSRHYHLIRLLLLDSGRSVLAPAHGCNWGRCWASHFRINLFQKLKT